MAKPFKIQVHTRLDKQFFIDGPDGFRLAVDYDDVNHKEVNAITKKMVAILNENWEIHGKVVGFERKGNKADAAKQMGIESIEFKDGETLRYTKPKRKK